MKTLYKSPIGTILLECNDKGISKLIFVEENEMTSHSEIENEITSLGIQQLDEYFAGKRKAFDIPLDLKGTPFQKRVWKELLKIPFGTTIS
jgi:methylated-DNA-[protein]-cysteine S-methyltransferase